MVADEARPLAVRRNAGQLGERALERRRRFARERQIERLVDREREQHVQLVAVLVTEERPLVVGRQVDLAEQDRVAAAAADEAPQVAQQLVRVDERAARHPHRLEHERDGVDAEAAEALLEPEADHLRDLVADLGVGHVEVGLVGVEAVQVELAGRLVPRPVGVLLVGEDDVAGLLRRLLVRPHVEVAVRRVLVGARGLEPRVLVGGVVHHQVGDHPDAAVARRAHELDEVAVGAEPRVDAVEVGDVVAVVLARRGVERHQPQARDAEAAEIVDPLGQAGQVADAVGVGVEERLDVEAVDDRVLPPQVAGGLALHRSSGRTCSPNASMNGSSSWPTWWR